MKKLLKEAVNTVKKHTGLNPIIPGANIRGVLKDQKAFDLYVKGLSEDLSETQAQEFTMLAENTRTFMMENSMFTLNPYETLTLPILRRFYPKLISKELVNVMPIDKPEVIKGFMRAYFGRYSDVDGNGQQIYPYQFPYVAPGDRKSVIGNGGSDLVDLTRGPSLGVNFEASAETGVSEWTVNLINVIGNNTLTRGDCHLEKDFRITYVVVDAGSPYEGGSTITLDTPVYASVDGDFNFDVSLDDGNGGEIVETVFGRVDFYEGVLDWRSQHGYVTQLGFVAILSLEENKINPKVKYEIEKIRFQVVLRQMQAEWTIPFEQDMKALYDVNAQAELVNIIGEQMAIEVDRENIDALIAGNAAYNDQTLHTKSFSRNPDPTTFFWGQKAWFENVIPVLNLLSAQVYNSTLMDSANTIACNPIDAAIFESLNGFGYDGNSVAGGEVGYRTGSIQGGKWKILTSTIVPTGKVIVKYRSQEMQRASFIYAPYVPALLTPYPIGAVPSLTVMTRYASKLIRPEAIAMLEITGDEIYG